jgi:pseudouridine synthase
VQAVGRLDADTTGVLLFTDDGGLIHRLTSPKHHVAKVYEVRCVHPVDGDQLTRLREGVVLHDDPVPVRAEACEATGGSTLRLTLVEGKYHQVKRMVAAAGNRVEALHHAAHSGRCASTSSRRSVALGRRGDRRHEAAARFPLGGRALLATTLLGLPRSIACRRRAQVPPSPGRGGVVRRLARSGPAR